MLKQRVLTALVLLPLVIALLLLAPLKLFAAAILVVIYLLSLEWAKLLKFRSAWQASAFAIAVSVVNLSLWWWGGDYRFWPSVSWPSQMVWDLPIIALAVALVGLVVAMVIVFTFSVMPKWWSGRLVKGLLAFALLPGFFVALVSIRAVGSVSVANSDLYHGGQLVLLMFAMIWAADTGAYLTGKAVGKTKLAAVVSPNKTWEGALGGVLLSLGVAWLGALWMHFEVENPLLYSLVAIFLAFVSIVGDLFESALKRVSNIKDSGNLLPGHGGVLDRLDSSIVVAPLFFLIFSYQGWL